MQITFRRGPHVEALLDGRVEIEGLNFTFVPVEPISRAFRRAIRDNEFEVTEMALVTLAMAADAGYPWAGLPVVLMSGLHHGALRVPNDSPFLGPRDLAGCGVGVRAYSQTTGVWVRGILETEYGVSAEEMTWVTTEDAHVPGFADPNCAVRAAEGATLREMLAKGEIAAAIGDGSSSFPGTHSLIADADGAAQDWSSKTGVYPVNHVIAVRKDLLQREPRAAGELMRAFGRARQLSAALGADNLPDGREAREKSINLGLEFAFRQGLIKRGMRYDDLFCA